jgi:hypothetical protein
MLVCRDTSMDSARQRLAGRRDGTGWLSQTIPDPVAWAVSITSPVGILFCRFFTNA